MADDSKIRSSELVARALIEDIASGALAPGAKLDEAKLAERFGKSRTPIREALTKLVGQHILTAEPGRGVFVAAYGLAELGQMFETMQELEHVCARLAAKRLTLLAQAEISARQQRCAELAQAGDCAGFRRANEAFHQAIYAAMQNPFLAELASSFRYRTGPFRAKRYRTKADLLKSIDFHEALVSSIVKDDQASMLSLRARAAASYIETLRIA